MCEHVVIVAHPSIVARFKSDLTVIIDDIQYVGKGPLAGLYTAMQHVTAERYMVLPCDMPYMTADVCKRVVNEAVNHDGVCAIQLNGQAHPLVSCWNVSTLNDISNALTSDQLGVMKLLNRVNTTWLDGKQLTAEAETVFCNVNRLDQWMN
ncbi:putative molybdenum cofactor guanylyltransferase [compost metagenome]